MRPALSACLALLFAAAPLSANKEPKVPKEVAVARFVYVQTIFGSVFDPRVPPDDRLAVARVEKAIQDWGKYHLTMFPREADLIIVVRKGRLASANVGGQVGRLPLPGSNDPNGGEVSIGSRPPVESSQSKSSTPTGVFGGVESGSPEDAMLVYLQGSGGTESAPIWMKKQDGGLDSPELPLFKKFRAAVEAAEKEPAKKKK